MLPDSFGVIHSEIMHEPSMNWSYNQEDLHMIWALKQGLMDTYMAFQMKLYTDLDIEIWSLT